MVEEVGGWPSLENDPVDWSERVLEVRWGESRAATGKRLNRGMMVGESTRGRGKEDARWEAKQVERLELYPPLWRFGKALA